MRVRAGITISAGVFSLLLTCHALAQRCGPFDPGCGAPSPALPAAAGAALNTFTPIFVDVDGFNDRYGRLELGRGEIIKLAPKVPVRPFIFIKEGGISNQPIQYGESVYMRLEYGPHNLKWLSANDGAVHLREGDLPHVATLLVVERPPGQFLNPRQARAEPERLFFHRPFSLRVANQQQWLVAGINGEIQITSDSVRATAFSAAEPPPPRRPYNPPSPRPPTPPHPTPTQSTGGDASGCIEVAENSVPAIIYRNKCSRSVRFTVEEKCVDINRVDDLKMRSAEDVGPNSTVSFQRASHFGSFCSNPALTKHDIIVSQQYIH